jgi:hypothetical protein
MPDSIGFRSRDFGLNGLTAPFNQTDGSLPRPTRPRSRRERVYAHRGLESGKKKTPQNWLRSEQVVVLKDKKTSNVL